MEGRRPLNVAFVALAVVLLLGKQEIRLQAADAEIGEAASNCLKKHTSDIELLHRGDPDWNAIRSGSLLRVDLEPAVIVVVRKTADIQASVYCAKRLSIPVVPRAGGHSFEGLSSTAGGILVYLGEHNEVLDFDEEKAIMKMAPGASLGQVYLQTWNRTAGRLAFGGGTCPQVGLAGHVLCVGWGMLGRKAGASMDQVLEIELVNAHAKVIKASVSKNLDLFRSLLGGCASSFGIVASITVKLQPLPPKITLVAATVSSNLHSARVFAYNVIRFAHTLCTDDFSSNLDLTGTAATLHGWFLGNKSSAQRMVDEFFLVAELDDPNVTKPVFNFTEVSYLDAAVNEAGGLPFDEWTTLEPLAGRQKRVWKTGYLDVENPWTLDEIERAMQLLNNTDKYGIKSTQIKFLGGAAWEKGRVQTPSGKYVNTSTWAWRHSMALYHHFVQFKNESERPELAAKVDLFDYEYQKLAGPGRVLSYITENVTDWRHDHWGSQWEKLVVVKNKWDPKNVFRNRLGIGT